MFGMNIFKTIKTYFLFLHCFFVGVGNDPREDRYFSIPKQVSAIIFYFFFYVLYESICCMLSLVTVDGTVPLTL